MYFWNKTAKSCAWNTMVLKNATPSTPTDASSSNQAKLHYTELPPARSSHHQRSTTTTIVTINRQPPKLYIRIYVGTYYTSNSYKTKLFQIKYRNKIRCCGYAVTAAQSVFGSGKLVCTENCAENLYSMWNFWRVYTVARLEIGRQQGGSNGGILEAHCVRAW